MTNWEIPTDRIVLDHVKDLDPTVAHLQATQQLEAIRVFARETAPEGATAHSVEIVYKHPFADEPEPEAVDTHDAVRVDLETGDMETLPPYDEIDPDWRAKR